MWVRVEVVEEEGGGRERGRRTEGVEEQRIRELRREWWWRGAHQREGSTCTEVCLLSGSSFFGRCRPLEAPDGDAPLVVCDVCGWALSGFGSFAPRQWSDDKAHGARSGDGCDCVGRRRPTLSR